MDLATFKILIDIVMFFIRLFSKNGENEKKVMEFQEIMQQKGMVSVELRLQAEAQLDEIDELWEKELKQED